MLRVNSFSNLQTRQTTSRQNNTSFGMNYRITSEVQDTLMTMAKNKKGLGIREFAIQLVEAIKLHNSEQKNHLLSDAPLIIEDIQLLKSPVFNSEKNRIITPDNLTGGFSFADLKITTPNSKKPHVYEIRSYDSDDAKGGGRVARFTARLLDIQRLFCEKEIPADDFKKALTGITQEAPKSKHIYQPQLPQKI